MKLISFLVNKDPKEIKIGAHCGDFIVDFSPSSLPKDMISFIELGDKALSIANDLVASQQNLIPLEDIALKAPIAQPGKILGVGLNYKEHLAEAKEIIEEQNRNIDLQEQYPNIFNKQNSSVAGPYDHIHRPNASDQLDYEGEMGFVIGKNCRHASYDDAKECIYGFTIVNDVTVRDWQFRGPPHTMTMGKSWDTHCPFGPYIVTADEVGNPHELELKTFVNEEIRQSSNTSLMIYNSYKIVEYLSTAFTLKPGDLIASGTPDGSAVTTQNWLKPGDKVKVEIEKLGYIENSIIQEPKSTKLIF